MRHEQDTVLQLQEVIEQLRNVFPSEPGEFTCAARRVEATTLPRRTLCSSITSKKVRGEQICTVVGR